MPSSAACGSPLGLWRKYQRRQAGVRHFLPITLFVHYGSSFFCRFIWTWRKERASKLFSSVKFISGQEGAYPLLGMPRRMVLGAK